MIEPTKHKFVYIVFFYLIGIVNDTLCKDYDWYETIKYWKKNVNGTKTPIELLVFQKHCAFHLSQTHLVTVAA